MEHMNRKNLTGKTAIVTGANCGIGFWTAVDFAKKGAKVIIACRNAVRGREALSEIKTLSQNTDVHLILLDLASFQSVRNFAVEFQNNNRELHILVNNAGVFGVPKSILSENGYEMHFAVNHLGHFLLTNLLLDTMKSSAPSRVINVSSSGHASSLPFDFEDINLTKNYSKLNAYNRSKLANVLFTRGIHKRYLKDGISSYSLNPGLVATEIARHTFLSSWLIKPLFNLVAQTPQQGAATIIYCATEPDIEHKSGEYFIKCQSVEPSSMAKDEDLAAELWEKSLQLTELQN